MNQKFKRKGKTMYKLTSISNRALSSLHASSVSRLVRLTFCLALLATLGLSHATAAVYEPFNYTGSVANGTAATGDGFNGNWTCGVAAYDQHEVDELIGVDGEEEFAVYLAPVGKVR